MVSSLVKAGLLTVILLMVVGGASVKAQDVKVGADPAVDLTSYKTYAWDKGSLGSNPFVSELIKSAVDAQLSIKGLKQVEVDPELTIVSFVSTESELYVTKPSWTPSMNPISTGIGGGSQTWPVTKGTLVIDISDTKTKNGVWRGTATHTLNNGPTGDKAKDAKTVAKPIKKAVEKMFKQYPHPSRKE